MKRCPYLKLIFTAMVILLCLSANTALAEQATKQTAYKETLQNSMPLNPAQIEQIKRLQEERQDAIIGRPAKVRVRTITLNVAPGMTPEKIITLPGYATSLSFFDQTGATWPVKRAKSGNPKAFHIEEPEEKNTDQSTETNTITTSCKADRGHSNLTVELIGMDLPIMFPLVMAPKYKKKPTIDGIVIVRITSMGPMAKPPVVEPRPADPVSDDLISYLDGISPNGAKIASLEPPNENIKAWTNGDKLFLRTSNPVFWPAWTAAVRGPGGTRVYEMPAVSSIMVSSDGQVTRYTIKSKTEKK